MDAIRRSIPPNGVCRLRFFARFLPPRYWDGAGRRSKKNLSSSFVVLHFASAAPEVLSPDGAETNPPPKVEGGGTKKRTKK